MQIFPTELCKENTCKPFYCGYPILKENKPANVDCVCQCTGEFAEKEKPDIILTEPFTFGEWLETEECNKNCKLNRTALIITIYLLPKNHFYCGHIILVFVITNIFVYSQNGNTLTTFYKIICFSNDILFLHKL